MVIGALLLAVAAPVAVGQTATRVGSPTALDGLACASASDAPPASVPAPALAWRGTTVRWAEWPVVLGTRRVRAIIIVAEVDPTHVALALDIARDGDALGPWTLDRAPANASIAFNAGQFTDDGPWGWVVHRGREWQPPGTGALTAAVVVDSVGQVRILSAARLTEARATGGVVEALQSYPMLLEDGRLPPALCAPGAIDREHRDIRLALGIRPSGEVVVALSRYAGAGRAGSRLPIGPTTLEMATIMRRLGTDRAVMLDGGLSAQLLIRDETGPHAWAGLRAVPLALVGRPKAVLAPGDRRR